MGFGAALKKSTRPRMTASQHAEFPLINLKCRPIDYSKSDVASTLLLE